MTVVLQLVKLHTPTSTDFSGTQFSKILEQAKWYVHLTHCIQNELPHTIYIYILKDSDFDFRYVI